MRVVSNRLQAGDTIIEVMIAIAVVSSVLVAAFATTNHNILATQDTQEHSQALQLAQSQVEFLHGSDIGTNDCFDKGGAGQVNNHDTAGNNPCIVTAGGDKAPSGAQPAFTLAISNTSGTTYQVQVSWESLTDSNQNNVTLYYQK